MERRCARGEGAGRMNLKETVAAGVETAFSAARDFVSLGTYTHRTSAPAYDPATDILTAGETTVSGVRMLRTSITAEEREASPLTVEDVKVLIPARDLPGFKPSETDYFELDGTDYNVLTLKTVPGDSLWIIFARKK